MNVNKKMKKMTVDEIHFEHFYLLKEIDELFKQNNIKYCLTFGTLLGCVRNGGAMPWDDDVDIMVFPESWDRMNEVILELNNEKYSVINKYTKPESPRWPIITEVSINGTHRDMSYFRDEINWQCGAILDIFSMVRVPDNPQMIHNWEKQLGVIDDVINMKAYKEGKCPTPDVASKFFYYNKWKNKSLKELNEMRDAIQNEYNKEGTYNYAVPMGPKGRYPLKKTVFKKSWLERLLLLDFKLFQNGRVVDCAKFPVPIGYEKVLETVYEDWHHKKIGRQSKSLSYWVNREDIT